LMKSTTPPEDLREVEGFVFCMSGACITVAQAAKKSEAART
jgi:hypothetical protein